MKEDEKAIHVTIKGKDKPKVKFSGNVTGKDVKLATSFIIKEYPKFVRELRLTTLKKSEEKKGEVK